jgi:CheY-like chemotaxis protein
VRADPGQVEQVLVNLAVNARDAMPGGGKLTIATRNADLDEEYARHHVGAGPGAFVVLTVSDTGHGMDEATMARIFEPFFTTKEVGKGTGLGLATVHGIVTQSGGHVEVWSEPGRGATFDVYLPRADATDDDCPPEEGARAPRGTETVLLAEDEDGVRALAKVSLQANGYTVLEARSGDEAVRLADRHPGPVHLLVTDVVMPKMSGRQLAERVTANRPGLKVLYLSGYSADPAVRHGLAGPGLALLQKPFTPTLLARKVREVLDGQPATVAD